MDLREQRSEVDRPMYSDYFGFREKPFNVTPDPRFFYANPIFEDADANLLYGIRERKGLILLTGEVGTGKTTLLRRLMETLDASIRFVFFYNTNLTFDELLTFGCEEFGVDVRNGGRLQKLQALRDFLVAQLAKGGTGVLLVDEAQNLNDDVLENLRLLSNLETRSEKLLQIVLVGQPELETMLDKPKFRQIKQRIAVRNRLDRLKDAEVGRYIEYRLNTAGCEQKSLFTPAAIQRITLYSKGVPRLINIICDNALLIAYVTSQQKVSGNMIEEVAQDLHLKRETEGTRISTTTAPQSTNGKEKPAEPTQAPAPTIADAQVLSKGSGPTLEPSFRLGTPLPEFKGKGNGVTQFIDSMTKALAEAMGPMASLVVRDQIAVLGESLDGFPRRRLDELVELVGREILHDKLKSDFRRAMSEIQALM
jgi:general secretion pathway protein A